MQHVGRMFLLLVVVSAVSFPARARGQDDGEVPRLEVGANLGLDGILGRDYENLGLTVGSCAFVRIGIAAAPKAFRTRRW